jgi:tetratricopeptide (TPR) repeat protein
VTTASIDELLRAFRRNLRISMILRVVVGCFFVAISLWALTLPASTGRPVLGMLLVGMLILWAALMVRSVRLAREIQTGNVLIAYGRLDDAEARLERMLGRFSLSERAQSMLFQQLAWLLFRRERFAEVVEICRELLRHRVGRIQGLGFHIRLMLADSLLLLGQVEEAYAAFRPVYDAPLTLAERMKLLPVQLRYELAAGHAGAAASGLAEKVRVAELLESPRAALVHALLAEACRRESMPAQQAFLAERARLYHDLEPLAEKYPIIRPVANE